MGGIPWLLVVALTAAACGPRYARVSVHDRSGLKVELRAELREGKPVDRGFSHPATISAVRVSNILSRIDVRLEGREGAVREPAFATELLYDLGAAVSEALARADPTQEVVIRAIRKERRLGIFTQEYLTSFVTYVLGDDLHVHLARVNYALPKGSDDKIPEPWPGREVMRFKVLPAEGIVPVGSQAVRAAWRDPLFRTGGQIRIGPGGRVMRREILLDSTTEPEAGEEPEAGGATPGP